MMLLVSWMHLLITLAPAHNWITLPHEERIFIPKHIDVLRYYKIKITVQNWFTDGHVMVGLLWDLKSP